jgi:C4-type Zn-finger protein
VSWHFAEGFDELECRHCGYRSDEADLAELERDAGDVLLQDESEAPPLRKKPLRA